MNFTFWFETTTVLLTKRFFMMLMFQPLHTLFYSSMTYIKQPLSTLMYALAEL